MSTHRPALHARAVTHGLALLAMAASGPGHAQAPPPAPQDVAAEIRALRQEMEAAKAAYESRLQALEERIKAVDAAAAASAVTAAGSAPAPTQVAASAAAPPIGSAAAGPNAFNPAISLILSGLFARSTRDPNAYAITGLQLPSGTTSSVGSRGFSLAESELGLSASVDPWWRGAANFSLHPDNTVSVEEAYVQTTALGNGLSLKLGRFLSGVGYLNPQHSHTWDFVDNPLAYQAFLGTQFANDGVQAGWIAPIDQYLELTAEIGRGGNFPGAAPDAAGGRNGAGATALALHTGGDIGDSNSWRAGVSVLNARAAGLSLSGLGSNGGRVDSVFDGRTRVWIVDGIWKWAPDGNATRTNFKLQAEVLISRSRGELAIGEGSGPTDYRATPSGWYLQAIYQFMPAWRVGLRTERINPGSSDLPAGSGLLASGNHHPDKQSLMVDWSPSEFSRLRLQLAQDRSRQGSSDQQLFLQYQMSLGAHGAHSY